MAYFRNFRVLCCELDDHAAYRHFEETNSDRVAVVACDKSSDDGVAVDVAAKRPTNRATGSADPAAALWHHPRTFSGLHRPSGLPSTSRRQSSSEGITSPDVDTAPRPEAVDPDDVDSRSTTLRSPVYDPTAPWTDSGLVHSSASPSNLTRQSSSIGITSSEVNIPPRSSAADSGDVDNLSTTLRSPGYDPTTPGGPTNIEILQRIFPRARRPVLDGVLNGCGGDLVRAVGKLLSDRDTTTTSEHGHSEHQLRQLQHLRRHQRSSGRDGPATRDGGPGDTRGYRFSTDIGAGFLASLSPNQSHTMPPGPTFLPSPFPALGPRSAFPLPARIFAPDALLGCIAPGLPAPPPRSRPVPFRPPPALAVWPQPTAAARIASPPSLGHPMRISSNSFHASLVDYYVTVAAATAAAAVGHVPLSSA